MAFDSFWKIFKHLYDTHCPVKIIKLNKNKHKINDFMTEDLITARNAKLDLYKIYINDRTITNENEYKLARNQYNTMLRQSKKEYYENNLVLNIKNPKRTWDLLKEATNLNRTSIKIDKIVNKNNQTLSDPTDIANEFNNFFTGIGVSISESVLETKIKPEEYMPNIDNLQYLELGNTSQTHICDIIKSLQSKNSMDIEGISTKLIKELAVEISIPLAHIFNISLSTGTFPNKLKESRTVPIFKAGNPELCDNYRPIALLSTLSKILEKMVSVQLVNHLDRNKILYEHQYGFQRNKSTEHNLIHAVNFIGKALNEEKYCVGVFFDLKKAFDVCNHDILLMKLSKMGIRGSALNWFKNYLSERKQKVDINGNLSDQKDIKISILQGSILGPILFLCFINDLHSVSSLLTLMFADDTFALESGLDLNTVISSVNNEINKMAVWFRANKLAVNINKTKYMIFRMRGKQIDINNANVEYNENEPGVRFDPNLVTSLERYHDQHENTDCRAYKLLGVYLDEHLSFNKHTSHLTNKLTRSLYCIKKAKNVLSIKGMKTLYSSLVHSHLTYCPIIMNCISAANRQKIIKVQKKAVRIMTNSKYNEHTAPIFKKYNILPYDKIIKQAKLLFMHSIEYKYAPHSFDNTWKKNDQRAATQALRDDDKYHLPHARTETFKKIPLYSLPEEWNKHNDMRYQSNRITFKWALRAQLLDEIE